MKLCLHYRYKLVPLIVLSIAPHYELILILFYQKILVFRKKIFIGSIFFFFMKGMNLFIKESEKKKKSFQIYYGNNLENPKLKIRVFASNNIIEAVNQYKMIQDLIQVQCRAYG